MSSTDAGDHPRPDRSRYPTRLVRLEDHDQNDDLAGTTPAERVAMMWPLALDAWAFMGKPVREPRLPRHVVRIRRRGR